MIPHWNLAAYRVAYYDKFGRPKVAPKYSLGFQAWWMKK
jgi:microcin C transport system substrate-binding protein